VCGGPQGDLADNSAGPVHGHRGPSGSGKSTLLNIMGALDVPTGGQVLWEGKDLALLGEQGRAEFRNRQVGFVFQLHHLLPQCTALENVLVPTLAKKAVDRRRPIFIVQRISWSRSGLRTRCSQAG